MDSDESDDKISNPSKGDPKKLPENTEEVEFDEDKEIDLEFEKAKEEVTKDGLALERYPQYQENSSFVELAIKHSKGFALQFAKAFQDDDKRIELAINENPYAVQFASERYCGDYDKMVTVVGKNGFLVQYAIDELRNSRTLAKLAVEGDGMALEFLTAFNDDDEIVEIAISNNSKAIKFASERIQKLKASKSVQTREAKI